jgi:hypothetical protein
MKMSMMKRRMAPMRKKIENSRRDPRRAVKVMLLISLSKIHYYEKQTQIYTKTY